MKKIFIALAIVVALLCFVSCSDITEVLFNVVQIDSLEDLETFRDRVNAGDTFEGKTVILTENIDLSGENWIPIGHYNSIGGGDPVPFSGTFDGNNKFIYNMTITNSPNYGALFGCVKDGEIRDITVIGRIDSSAGSSESNVVNSAGIVGYTTSTEDKTVVIKNCTSWVNITITNDEKAKVGGIVAKNDGNLTIENCKNEGIITSSGLYVGGIVGDIEGYPNSWTDASETKANGWVSRDTKISKCINNGTVSKSNGKSKGIGPIVGFICDRANVTLSDCKDKDTNTNLITTDNYSKGTTTEGKINYVAGTITVDDVKIFEPTT